jgi:hypothetical protein
VIGVVLVGLLGLCVVVYALLKICRLERSLRRLGYIPAHRRQVRR